MSGDGQTIKEKYNFLITQLEELQQHSPKNTLEFQNRLLSTIHQFETVKSMITSLDVFSDNDFFEDINPSYLPFLNIDYYLGELRAMTMVDQYGKQIGVEFKPENLQSAKKYYNDYLNRLKDLEILNPHQIKQLEGAKLSREEKIESYKYEKELKLKLKALEGKKDDMDEDVKRDIYSDEIKLNVMKCLNALGLIEMELDVLNNRPLPKIEEIKSDPSVNDASLRDNNKQDDYTTKLETIPKNTKIGDILKNGKILQPFTITRESLREKVFGTGQTLPSMTVEEYLDWELANGKMMKPEAPPVEKDSDKEDEEEEYKNRAWDDWKDDNPKGIGNTMNLG